MAKQSKNKVKLEKKYKTVGRIPIAAFRKIREFMDLPPENILKIRANFNNVVKHNHKHFEEFKNQLAELGMSPEDYVEFVTHKFNEIREGKEENSVILVVFNEDIQHHMAALHLHYELNENFWLVTTVHAIRPKELEKKTLIWKK